MSTRHISVGVDRGSLPAASILAFSGGRDGTLAPLQSRPLVHRTYNCHQQRLRLHGGLKQFLNPPSKARSCKLIAKWLENGIERRNRSYRDCPYFFGKRRKSNLQLAKQQAYDLCKHCDYIPPKVDQLRARRGLGVYCRDYAPVRSVRTTREGGGTAVAA